MIEKELQKKSKINPLELTLDKFDQVVDRFSKVIMSLDLSGGQLPDKSDLDAFWKSTDQKKLLLFYKTTDCCRNCRRKRKKTERTTRSRARVREGFMGDALV